MSANRCELIPQDELEHRQVYDIDLLSKPIGDLFAEESDDIVFQYPQEKIWNPNGISLQKRIGEDANFESWVEKVLAPDNVTSYVVGADLSAPTRCIDGRMTEGWLDDPTIQKRPLGPKIAGGTPHAALAHRIVDVENLRSDLLFESDIEYVVRRYKDIGIGFGGHLDDHASGWNTGCGAVDNINKILETLQLPEPQQQLRALTKLIMGESYEGQHITNEIIGRMLLLDAMKPRYMPKENMDPAGQFLYKKKVAEILRAQAGSDREPVPKLVGLHNEVGIMLNFASGTTLDSDRFSADNNGELQLFGWDIWEMYEEAERLYPYTYSSTLATQESALRKRNAHVACRTLLGISTAMVLTDGSLRLLVVKSA